jgi:hypothetical protein
LLASSTFNRKTQEKMRFKGKGKQLVERATTINVSYLRHGDLEVASPLPAGAPSASP